MPARISSLSKEYLVVPVKTNPGGVAVNTAIATVEFAFLAGGEPQEADWKNGEWTSSGQTDYARVLIGPGSTAGALSDGNYTVWLRVSQSPEVVVRPAGSLTVS